MPEQTVQLAFPCGAEHAEALNGLYQTAPEWRHGLITLPRAALVAMLERVTACTGGDWLYQGQECLGFLFRVHRYQGEECTLCWMFLAQEDCMLEAPPAQITLVLVQKLMHLPQWKKGSHKLHIWAAELAYDTVLKPLERELAQVLEMDSDVLPCPEEGLARQREALEGYLSALHVPVQEAVEHLAVPGDFGLEVMGELCHFYTLPDGSVLAFKASGSLWEGSYNNWVVQP